MWFEYRYQAKMSFPAMNPKHMLIYSRMVYHIRPHGLQILTLTYFQHFQEVRNTAWFITVPNVEHKRLIEGWVKRGVVVELLPFEKDFNKLTWHPTYYDGQIPPVNRET